MKELSAVFVEYIQPAIEYFGRPKPRTIPHDAACALGHVVWNAVVMESLNPGKDYLEAAKSQGGNVQELNTLFDQMAERKRKLFANDNRLIGVYDVADSGNGGLSLWAEVIEPLEVN